MTILIEDLSKSFGSFRALDRVSLTVPEGSFFSVVGPSGCGKSTLLRLIAGLETPDEGRIALNGTPMVDTETFVPPEDRKVGVVFQSYALWPHLTVAGNVAFPYESRGVPGTEAKARAMAHLETVSLTDYAERCPEALSGGQRQRVALARCLAGEAQTILMDEPLANLDPHLRNAMEGELRGFHDRSGVTTLYITHDQREAMALSDVMAVMDAGRVQQIGTPQEVYQRPATGMVARFIGRGTLVPAQVRGGSASIHGQTVPVDAVDDGAWDILIRPEQISVAADGLAVSVIGTSYRGGSWEVTAVHQDGTMFTLDLPGPVRVADPLHLVFYGGWAVPRVS